MTTIRTMPKAAELEQLVTVQITGMTDAHDRFTAHDVTAVLRLGHPDLEIAHVEVRALVHDQMRRMPGYHRVTLAVLGQPFQYVPDDATVPAAASVASLPTDDQATDASDLDVADAAPVTAEANEQTASAAADSAPIDSAPLYLPA
jgi:hypothetical protein